MSLGVGEAKIETFPNKISLTGFLIFDTVLPIYQSGLGYLATYSFPELEIDLSQVEKSDSSGLSLLLGWMRAAKQKKINLHFTNVPRYLLDVARVCGIDNILPITYS
jgi:phospholipid transport system transporter-binding protein